MWKKILVCMILIMSFSGVGIGDTTAEIHEIYVGESIQFLEHAVAELGTTNIAWKTSNEVIDEVLPGVYKGEKAGSVVVYAHDLDTYETLVFGLLVESSVDGFEIITNDSVLKPNEQVQLEYRIKPKVGIGSPYENSIKWVSSNPSVARVDDSGTVYAIKKGKTSISGQTLDGAYKDQVYVDVESPYSYISTSSSGNDIILPIGDTVQLDVYREPGRVLVEKPVWRIGNPSLISISDSGKITGNLVGSTMINVFDPITGYDKMVRVRVNSNVKAINIRNKNILINDKLPAYQLTYDLIPYDVSQEILEDTVMWTSSDSRIAKVSDTGLVTPVGNGTVTISAITKDGNQKDTAKITVSRNVVENTDNSILKDVSLGDMPYRVVTGETLKIKLENIPENFAWNDIKVFIKEGSSDQIQVKTDGIYVTPSINVANEVSLKDLSGNQVVWQYWARSYLNRIDIIDDTLPNKRSGVPTLFIGQTWELDYELFAVSGFDESDIVMRGVTWSSDEEDIADFTDDRNGRLIGIKEGEFTVRVETDDSSRYDTIKMRVENLVKRIELPKEAMVSVEKTYKPEIDYVLAGGIEKPFIEDYEIELINQVISKEVLQEERVYEVNLIASLEQINSLSSANTELSKHRRRLAMIEAMLEYSSGEYAPIQEGFTTRLGDPIEIIIIEQMMLSGNVKGKAQIKITTRDNEQSDNMQIIVD